jgi:hypothetical protein
MWRKFITCASAARLEFLGEAGQVENLPYKVAAQGNESQKSKGEGQKLFSPSSFRLLTLRTLPYKVFIPPLAARPETAPEAAFVQKFAAKPPAFGQNSEFSECHDHDHNDHQEEDPLPGY